MVSIFSGLNGRFWTMIIVLMMASLMLAGCGDDTEPPATATTVMTPTAIADATTDISTVAPATLPAQSSIVTATTSITDGAAAAAVAGSGDTGVLAIAPVTPTAPSPEIEEGCEIEPNADLIGYDGVIERLGCPIAEANNDPVGINEFGEGPDYKRFMLWFGGEGQIYVLTGDGRWLAYTDTWEEGDPEITCNPENLDPATSPPLPRRGFGKLWCTVDTVRTAMGHIDREERLCQHAVVQRFERGRLLACFEDATIRYYRILEDGTWDMESVQ
jgi:hypothetical protein